MDPLTDDDRAALARIFDAAFYTSFYPDLGEAAEDPLAHFLAFGLWENRRPHPLFSPEFYLKANTDVRESGASPVLHYLKFGGPEWRAFSPFVDADRYYEHYRGEVARTATGTALEDFCTAEDRSLALQFFDAAWYGADPALPFDRALENFLVDGLKAQRDPHPLIRVETFLDDAESYPERFLRFESLFLPDNRLRNIATHPLIDIDHYAARYGVPGIHPVVHFLRVGQGRGGITLHPLFDPDYYAAAHGLSGSAEAMTHYVRAGLETEAPNPFIDPAPYRARFAHTFLEGETVLQHYMRMGHLPWFEPGPNFAQRYYVTRHGDALKSGTPALLHYLQEGRERGFAPRPAAPALDVARNLTTDGLVDRIRALELQPAEGPPEVAVIVPVYGELDVTLRCVLSLLTAATAVPFEVVIADDASPDGSGDRLAEAFAGHPVVRVHRRAENLGFLRSCNEVAAECDAPFLAFLNNDTVVLDGWLDELVGTFARVPKAGLVGARLVYPNGLLQEAGGVVWADGSAANYGRLDDPFAPRYGFARDVDYVSGAAIVVRRDLWERLGGFSDEFAPAYYEDTDFAMKVRAAGWRVILQPLATVVHHEGVTSGTDVTQGVKRYQVVNKEKFIAKWRTALAGNGRSGDLSPAATDRRARGRILLFDAEVPAPDRDSGSVTTYFYMRLLSELGFRVTFLSNSMQRRGRYTADLQRLGVEVLYAPYVPDPRAYITQHAREYDLLVLARAPVGGKLLPLLKAKHPDVPMVFDTVDLHHLRLLREYELTGVEETQRRAWEMREIELAAIRCADATLLVSEHELEFVRHEVGPFPHMLLPLIYEPYRPKTPFAGRRDIAFVGGYRHPPNIDAVEWLLDAIWPRVRELLADEAPKLHIIGADLPRHLAARAEGDVEMVGYVRDLEAYLEGMRLTVAPLRYGAGVKGKVGNALRLGVPVVATPVASEGMSLVDGEHLLVGRDERELAEAIARLYTDARLWGTLSSNGRAFAEERFGLAAARRKLEDLCRGLIRRPV